MPMGDPKPWFLWMGQDALLCLGAFTQLFPIPVPMQEGPSKD